MKNNFIKIILFTLCFFLSCEHSSSQGKEKKSGFKKNQNTLKIVSWNVQTFFDAVDDGTEYSEFRSSKSRWGKEAYEARLDRLCNALQELNADVFILSEVENAAVMYDISNRLAGNSWSRKYSWDYACFTKNSGDAIGLALLSRYPLSNLSTHNVDIRTDAKQARMRPIVKVSLSQGDKNLTIFANHWKSKSGGAELSEVWRNWQEHTLSTLLAENQNVAILACGDFNRDISEFKKCEKTFDIAFRRLYENDSVLHSTWYSEHGSLLPSYSYYYDGAGERIDHVFYSKNVNVISFAVEDTGSWADENGMPYRYTLYTGKGYSDHFPLSATISY